MSGKIHIEHRVETGRSGMRLDQVAADCFPDFSRARLQSWIREGCLTVDGRNSRPAARLAGGELLVLDAEPEPDGEVLAQSLPLDVIYADEHIIIINKQAGIVVHPAGGNPDGTLQNALLYFDSELARIPRAGIVHRLDKDTSGIMVVARSLKAHAALVRQLQERSMSRIYETIVHGLAPAQGRVEADIGRHPRVRQRMAVVPGGKPAVTHFRVLHHFGHFSHLEVSLESGRTHQIRVHMQHIGFPLVGDPVYGRKLARRAELLPELREVIETFPRQALHARRLRLLHPRDGAEVVYETPLPDDLSGLLRMLEQHDD